MINAEIAKGMSIKEEARKKSEFEKKYNLYTEKILTRSIKKATKKGTYSAWVSVRNGFSSAVVENKISGLGFKILETKIGKLKTSMKIGW